MSRPNVVLTEHLDYLDALRESGVTNMFGAGQYVKTEFGLSTQDARTVLNYWMETFGEETR